MIRLAFSSGVTPLLAAAGTYLLHSTVLVVVVWALARCFLGGQPAAANRLWRWALLAPVISTAVVLALPARLVVLTVSAEPPAVAVLGLAPAGPVPGGAGGGPDLAGPRGSDRRADVDRVAPVEWVAPVERPAGSAMANRTAAMGAAAGARLPAPGLLPALLGLAGLIVLVRLGRLGVRLLVFRRSLRGRTLVAQGAARERLDALSARAALGPVVLTVSDRIAVPLVLAAGRREICLPRQALDGLATAELDAVLAHELAHLERGDNGWLLLAGVLEAVLFIQPLCSAVRRRLQESAELACDQRAVELTGSARALARSLAEVAAWNLGDEPPLPVSAMAHRGGLLLRRVQTLLADARPARRLGSRPIRLLLAGLGALAVFLPALGGGGLTPLRLEGDAPLMAVAAAAPRLPPSIPKATAAGSRFDRPPLGDGGTSAGTAGRLPAGSMPPLPGLPVPLPPVGDLPPFDGLLAGVLNDVLPRALRAAGELAPLATREAGLKMRLQSLEQRQSRGQASSTELAEIPRLRGEVADARQRRQQAEDELERDMEAVGKHFEKGPGKDLERNMQAWSEQYGKQLETWGKEYGKQLETWGEQWSRWGEEFGRRMQEQQRRRGDRTPAARGASPRRVD